ncbi:uncharacterized protein TRAVEDRAFT_54529 [Trametes versicolor FP-101664 SS1]|uniref:Uncharacterized protein n=1 Tax=Trametes versicolor (strain FP-101664) TaxID=717944 RepID=R7S6G6_TRAVS|nr:uncharacterized protein TRAVEDRAFT_54529 [Trametes versicolor FP-101664 SS1]EIW51491.1 hypothetical protein TRAVEDRAFT_54529 [Trametes versicolor FP-101664 SS1]
MPADSVDIATHGSVFNHVSTPSPVVDITMPAILQGLEDIRVVFIAVLVIAPVPVRLAR